MQNKRYRDEKISRLRHLKKNNPREYWKIINSSKKSDKNVAPLKEFYNFFKNVNTQGNSESEQCNTETYNTDFELSDDDDSKEINQLITESEVLSTAKSLKNNKSPGLDCIVNEHIKSTIHIMLPVYVKLFNLIFDTGIIPESWTTGVIKPIFKNKGSPEAPENYRPITLLSCFGKLFTAIINNRLKKYAEKYEIIGWSQSGFRKGYSTTENLFIIKSLIDIMQASKKKLFCCFIDFKQAFDTVWRVGLWKKTYSGRYNGKML